MATKPSPPAKQPTFEPGYTPPRPNAWQGRDWETLFVALVFLIALGVTAWMIFISVTGTDPDNRFRIIPAAGLMLLVELWVFVSLPLYNKLAFWGAVLSLATYLFFAVPFVFLGLLPDGVMIGAGIFIVISLVCGL